MEFNRIYQLGMIYDLEIKSRAYEIYKGVRPLALRPIHSFTKQIVPSMHEELVT